MKILLVILLSLTTSSVWAKKSVKNKSKYKDQTHMTAKRFKKELRRIKKRRTRKPAANYDQNSLSPQFVKLRDQVIGSETSKEVPGVFSVAGLDNLIKKVNADYDSYNDPAEKLLAAQLAFMKIFKGLIHRAKPLVKKHDIARSAIISGLRFSGQAVQIYTPTPQWKAGYEYFISPFKTYEKPYVAEISDDASFKNYIMVEVIPALTTLKARINDISFAGGIVWDNKVFNQEANFSNNQDRFVLLTNNEKNALLSVISGSLSASHGLKAYSLDGFFNAANRIAKNYGFNAMFQPSKATSSARRKIIISHKDLFIKSSTFAQDLPVAFSRFKESVRYAKLAWEGIERTPDGNGGWTLLNAQALNGFSRIVGNNIESLAAIVIDRKQNIASIVNRGDIVKLNLKAFFTPGQAPEDLKHFLPIDFDDRATRQRNGIKFSTYLDGRPTDWNEKYYQKYFPNVKTDADIERTAKVLSQANGGWLFGMPLGLMMF